MGQNKLDRINLKERILAAIKKRPYTILTTHNRSVIAWRVKNHRDVYAVISDDYVSYNDGSTTIECLLTDDETNRKGINMIGKVIVGKKFLEE